MKKDKTNVAGVAPALPHTQNLSGIRFNFTLQLYCPQGNEHYTAKVKVHMLPDEYLPDYVELDKVFRQGCGEELIIEDAVEWVYDLIWDRYKPYALTVEANVEDAIHFDVQVSKSSEGWCNL